MANGGGGGGGGGGEKKKKGTTGEGVYDVSQAQVPDGYRALGSDLNQNGSKADKVSYNNNMVQINLNVDLDQS